MIPRFLAISSVIILGLPALAAEDFKQECQSEYAKNEPVILHGAVRYSSQQVRDQKECAGKVGATFCLDDKVKTYHEKCLERKKQEKQAKLKELRKSIKEAEAQEEAERLRQLEIEKKKAPGFKNIDE